MKEKKKKSTESMKGFEQIEESVHLTDFPQFTIEKQDINLEYEMDIVRHAVNVGRSLRTINKLKIRQPLGEMFVVATTERDKKIIITCVHKLIFEYLFEVNELIVLDIVLIDCFT